MNTELFLRRNKPETRTLSPLTLKGTSVQAPFLPNAKRQEQKKPLKCYLHIRFSMSLNTLNTT